MFNKDLISNSKEQESLNECKKKLRILHIITDHVFFNDLIGKFEADSRITNRAILPVDTLGYMPTYLKVHEKYEKIDSYNKIKQILRSDSYDVAFFHTLSPGRYKYLLEIPKSKIVVWWSWGYDIYMGGDGLKPMIPLELYKPLTREMFDKNTPKINLGLVDLLKRFVIKNIQKWRLHHALKRVNYHIPVISTEYDILKDLHKEFTPKLFHYPISFFDKGVILQKLNNKVMLGNSATFTNNHADIISIINSKNITGMEFVMPLNYGDNGYADLLSDTITLNNNKCRNITEFLPKEEYFDILHNTPFFISGVIRQQSMGNINSCLLNGVKVFLFKDSMVYKYLVDKGFVVFSIEEMTQNSFSSVLTLEESRHNHDLMMSIYDGYNELYNSGIEEMIKSLEI